MHSILLVEDDHELHSAMTAILEAEGYRVIGAFDGEEAINRLREGARPSVVVLDLMLPRKDGLQFRAEQLADPELAPIPVILYSGDDRLAEAATAFRVPHWFSKPIDFGAMLEAISRYCPEW
jgi:two-component system response regulator MprA